MGASTKTCSIRRSGFPSRLSNRPTPPPAASVRCSTTRNGWGTHEDRVHEHVDRVLVSRSLAVAHRRDGQSRCAAGGERAAVFYRRGSTAIRGRSRSPVFCSRGTCSIIDRCCGRCSCISIAGSATTFRRRNRGIRNSSTARWSISPRIGRRFLRRTSLRAGGDVSAVSIELRPAVGERRDRRRRPAESRPVKLEITLSLCEPLSELKALYLKLRCKINFLLHPFKIYLTNTPLEHLTFGEIKGQLTLKLLNFEGIFILFRG